MNDQGDLLNAGMIWTRMDWNLGGLCVSYLATTQQIANMRGLDWHDDTLPARNNKRRMKQLSTAIAGYRLFLNVSAVLSLAKSIEDTLFLVDDIYSKKLAFWSTADRLAEGAFAKEIRCLANVIKHNHGIVDTKQSTSARHLVTECGYTHGQMLETSLLSENGGFDVLKSVAQVYCFESAVVAEVTGISHPIMKLAGEERLRALREHLVPPMLGL